MNALYYTPPIENAYIGHILKEIYQDRVYHPFLAGQENLTILDIGANIGLTSQYFSQFANTVYAVEPSKQHFDCLSKMIKTNKISNVKPVNVALGNKPGKMTLHHNTNTTMFSLSPAVGSTGEEVEVVTFVDLFSRLKLKHVNFVKLDVEGMEMEVLGGEAFRKVAGKIDAMLIEYHTWSGRNPGQLVQALQQTGFQVQQVPSEATLFAAYKV